MSDLNGTPDLSGIISKLTENPELMKSLRGIAGNLSADGGEIKRESCPERKSDACECREEGGLCECKRDDKCSKPTKCGRGGDAENLIRLLIALKPYVSDERCEKIDSIVRILKLVQLSEKSGLLKSLL